LDASQAPQLSDKLVDGAEVWQIVHAEAVSPAGTPVAHKVQIRR
jgi:hypothetical protein